MSRALNSSAAIGPTRFVFQNAAQIERRFSAQEIATGKVLAISQDELKAEIDREVHNCASAYQGRLKDLNEKIDLLEVNKTMLENDKVTLKAQLEKLVQQNLNSIGPEERQNLENRISQLLAELGHNKTQLANLETLQATIMANLKASDLKIAKLENDRKLLIGETKRLTDELKKARQAQEASPGSVPFDKLKVSPVTAAICPTASTGNGISNYQADVAYLQSRAAATYGPSGALQPLGRPGEPSGYPGSGPVIKTEPGLEISPFKLPYKRTRPDSPDRRPFRKFHRGGRGELPLHRRERDRRSRSRSPPPRQARGPEKGPYCDFWLKVGYCSYEDRGCDWIHEIPPEGKEEYLQRKREEADAWYTAHPEVKRPDFKDRGRVHQFRERDGGRRFRDRTPGGHMIDPHEQHNREEGSDRVRIKYKDGSDGHKEYREERGYNKRPATQSGRPNTAPQNGTPNFSSSSEHSRSRSDVSLHNDSYNGSYNDDLTTRDLDTKTVVDDEEANGARPRHFHTRHSSEAKCPAAINGNSTNGNRHEDNDSHAPYTDDEEGSEEGEHREGRRDVRSGSADRDL